MKLNKGIYFGLGAMLLMQIGMSHAADKIFLPKDESPHPNFGNEWWYSVGHVQGLDPSGVLHQYSFYFGTNRVLALGQAPNKANYSVSVSITDLNKGTQTSELLPASLQPEILPSGGGFNLPDGNDIHMTGKLGYNSVDAKFSDGSYSINIKTIPKNGVRPSVNHGDGGVIPYGPFGTSFYYSETNLTAVGTIIDHGVPITVTGISWLDRQWGNFLAGPGGWNWFCPQLNNGTQYMLYFVLDGSGNLAVKIGTLINADGSKVNLDPNSIVLTTVDTWTSPKSGLTYGHKFLINLPNGQLTVTAKVADQEVAPGWWEGPAAVVGTINGQAVAGDTYVELIPHFPMPTPH